MANFGAPQGGYQFGATPTGLFGNKPTTTQSTNLFGTPSTNTTFGAAASTAPNTGFSFGAPAASTATPNLFGTPTPISTPSLFGTQPSTAANTGFGFGAQQTAAPSTGLNFGTPVSTAAKPSLFAAPASSVPSTGLNFGTPASGNTGFSFGATPASSAATGFSLGSTLATTSATGFSLGGTTPAFGATVGTSAPGTGLSFGLGATSSAPSLGLNFGTSTAATTSAFGLGTSTSTLPTFGLGEAQKPPTTAAPVGLGGIATTQPKQGILKSKGQTDISPKDQPLPNEIMQGVEEFKNYVKQQKAYCSEICRYSIKEFRKVESDIDTANALINDVEKQLQLNRQIAEKLKYDTAKGLQHVEMAQRTFDTPPGLQFDNTAPFQFFVELTDNFERDMQTLKAQIESTAKYLKNIGRPEPLTSQDLALGMRRLHETFVALAGRLQSVHNQVETQKEQYLNLRKYLLHDDTNVFEKLTKDEKMNVVFTTVDYKPPSVVTGPTPFNPLTNPNVAAQSLQVSQLAQSQYPGTPGMQNANITPQFGVAQPSTSTLFGSSTPSFGQGFGINTANNFQLQKPPVGNKRSK